MSERRALMQLRIVRVIYRAESRWAERVGGRAAHDALGDIRRHSLDLLGSLRPSLGGGEVWHAAILAAVGDLEREISDTGPNGRGL